MVETLEIGRSALQSGQWEEARSALDEADHGDPLSPPDLELLAEAAWWAGQPDQSVEVLERAFNGYLDDGTVLEAARVAALLTYFAFRHLAFSIGAGWHAKAKRLIEGQPESKAHAYVKFMDLAVALKVNHDLEFAKSLADDVIELARRTGTPDVEAQALVFKGEAEVASGNWKEGLALIDEATASALSGNLSLRSASDVYCVTMLTCSNLADYGRAGEWTEKADRWMSQHAVGGYPGMCRVHRAELKRLKGDWVEAEEEARGACVELERYRIFDGLGFAQYEIGEIRLAMGDVVGAEEAFTKAFELGWDPQPGLALLMLAKGDPDEAAHTLERRLAADHVDDAAIDRLARARILPAQVEVALVRGDLVTATTATEELFAIADQFDQPAFRASADLAQGRVAAHAGDFGTAISHLEKAWKLWRDLEFPYESARARMLLGEAHLAAGEESLARMELGAARSVFERLGAGPDLRVVDGLIHGVEKQDGERTRVTKTFLFTDIVTSTDLVGLIGDAAWESLLAWHDRELRSIFASHRGIEVRHTGDGFFVTFDRVTDAAETAVAVQRRLADHRREQGFAPSVRIGLHTDEATVAGDDYRGGGVHLAARVGAAAGTDEIVVSDSSLAGTEALGYPISDPRPVDLKGIKEPVLIRTIEWR
jgi:class 3 adenylate cyclase